VRINPPSFAVAVLNQPERCHYCDKEIPPDTPIALAIHDDTDHICPMHMECWAKVIGDWAMERYKGMKEEREQAHRMARHLWN
jgi:hypothetical protein